MPLSTPVFGRLIPIGLACGVLAACQTAAPTEPPVRPDYQTRSERAVERLAICVAESSTDACQSQAVAACTTIQNEAFNNPYSSGVTLANFTRGDATTRTNFKLSTANTVLQRLGYGRNFCG
ncbi:MAG: hypothetical protein ACE37E_00470 [Hyphomicrobiales bacterium]